MKKTCLHICGVMSSQKQIQIKQEPNFKVLEDLKPQIPFLADVIKQKIKTNYECVTVAENCSNIRQCEGRGEVKEEPDDQAEESSWFQVAEEKQPASDADYKDLCPCYSCTSSSPQQDILDSHVKLEHSTTDVGFNKDDLQDVLTGDKRCRTCKTESTPRKRSPETGREDNIKLKPAESFSFKTCPEQGGSLCVNSNLTLDIRNCEEKSNIECSINNKNALFNNSLRNVHLNNSGVVHSEEGWHKSEKFYKHAFCRTKFSTQGSLHSHKRIHKGDRHYKCGVCGAVFTQHSSLKSHKRMHTGEKPYKCEICGVCFTVSGALLKHKRTHTGEKNYKCDICSAQFTQKGHLKSHKRTHTGEKPYKCDVCGYGFAVSSALTKHKRIHTGEKPYKCDICGAEFTRSCILKSHKRTHTGEKPYKCDVCGAEFTQCTNLKSHKRTHTGEKPYKCEICGTEFTQCSNLKSHRRTHTREKPYKCDVCGVRFAFSSNLTKHKRTHI